MFYVNVAQKQHIPDMTIYTSMYISIKKIKTLAFFTKKYNNRQIDILFEIFIVISIHNLVPARV